MERTTRLALGRGAILLLMVCGLTLFCIPSTTSADPEPAPVAKVGRQDRAQLEPADIAAAPIGTMGVRFDRYAETKGLRKTSSALSQWKICDPCKRSRRWDVKLGPYGWLAGVRGSAYEDGRSQDFEIAFSDITELVSGGFQFYAEFGMDRWFIAFDGTWATLQKDFPWRLGTFGFKIEQKIIELRGGYRLIGPSHGKSCDCKTSCCPPPRRDRFALDVYAGARYWHTDTTLRLGIGPGSFEGSSTDDWVDPIVGVRMGYQLAPKWVMGYRLDVGGFGIGKASSFTYRSFLGFDWQFANHWTLALGYQVIGLDRVTGSGATKNGTDITQHGPLFGLLYDF